MTGREDFPIFTLEQANLLVPKLIELTEATIRELEAAKSRQQTQAVIDAADSSAAFEAEVSEVLQGWAERVTELGIHPKGYFTCDFRSPDPSAYLCWTYGENGVCHTHKVWETFKDRKPIDDPRPNGIAMSLN